MSTQFPYDDGYGGGRERETHEAAGAYVLGLLDDAEATAFEAHLAGCDLCAAHLEEFAGLEPMLATLADFPPGAAPTPGTPPAAPAPAVLDRLLDEVAARRARRARLGLGLAAAAAALIIGGPLAVIALSDDSAAPPQAGAHTGSPARDAFLHRMDEKVRATDRAGAVTATVGMEAKAWGTHTVLELKNVKGPLRCSLVAVGKGGEEETVTSWAVPKWGYGIEKSPHEAARSPLYVHGGTAMDRGDIDRFEVRTSDGARLVEIEA